MTSSYTPAATKHATVTLMSDGEVPTAASLALPIQQTSDRTAHLYNRLMYRQHIVAAVNHTALTASSAATIRAARYLNGYAITAGTSTSSDGVGVSSNRSTFAAASIADSAVGDVLYDIAFGNGWWVVVGGNGLLGVLHNTATPASSWSSGTIGSGLAPSRYLRGVAYGASVFVAVGEAGTIYSITSPPAFSPTLRTPPASYTGTYSSVAYGASRFVAVGQSSAIHTSADGSAWAAQTSPSATTYSRVAYGNGLWVAVGSNGFIVTSSNGTLWTQRTAPASYTGTYNDVCWTGGAWLAVGTGGVIHSSQDGITWEALTTPAFTDDFYACGAGGGYVFLAGDNAAGTTSVLRRSQYVPGD
jgi:hypothetical protein